MARSGGEFVFAQHPSVGKNMNALLQQVFQQFGGKGGGTHEFARGRLSDGSQVEQAIAFAQQQLTARTVAQ